MFNRLPCVILVACMLLSLSGSPIALAQPKMSGPSCEICRDRDCSGRQTTCSQATSLTRFKCEARKKRWITRCESAKRICIARCDQKKA